MLLQAGGETRHRNLLRRRQHQGRAGRHLADLVPAGRDDGHAVDAGPAGLDREVELLLLEVAEMLGRDLAHLVVAGEPAELEVDGLGLGLGETARRQQARGGEAGGGRTGLEQRPAANLAGTELAHGDFPFVGGFSPCESY